MKRIILSVTLLLAGMAVLAPSISAQDLSYYNTQYNRPEASFADRLQILEAMQEAGVQGTPEFYHNALRLLLAKGPEITNRNEQQAAERSLIIISQELGAAKYTAAATDLWHACEFFDVVNEPPRTPNEGNAQQTALIALANVDGRQYIPHIVQRLNDYNVQSYRNTETRRRVQTAVIGCIRALEIFKDISGYRPVFFALTGQWEASVKQIASSALPNIAEDPADVVIEIIRDPSSTPPIKLEAWNELARTRAPNASRARVAAVAMEIGWTYTTSNRVWQTNLRTLRRNALEIIRLYGAVDATVYTNLERSYSNNFINNQPDYDEIAAALNALSALKTDEAVALLKKFLEELDGRRRSGPWGNKERQLFEWVVLSIGFTGTNNMEVRLLLTSIRNSDRYTAMERTMAGNALGSLGN